MNVNIEIANYNDKNISYRKSDGFVNATEMCQVGNKKVNDWLRLDSTNAYIQALSRTTGIKTVDLTSVKTGSPLNGGGTWIHPKLTFHLEQWLQKNQLKENVIVGDIYVYCDNGNNAYKIGFTTNLIKREKQHKTSNPFLELIKIYSFQQIENEQVIHEKLRKYQIKGTTEWYVKRPQVLKIVNLILNSQSD